MAKMQHPRGMNDVPFNRSQRPATKSSLFKVGGGYRHDTTDVGARISKPPLEVIQIRGSWIRSSSCDYPYAVFDIIYEPKQELSLMSLFGLVVDIMVEQQKNSRANSSVNL
jgi:hypothetical protein